MKILISTFGTRGDVQPYIALGAALRARAHDVTLSTGQGFDDMIAAYGLTPAPATIDYRTLIQTPEAQAALRTMRGKFKAFGAFKSHMRQQLDDMWQIAREVRPDAIVYHPKAHASQHIAEALGIAAIPTTLQPLFVPTEAFPCPLLPFVELGARGNRASHQILNWLMPKMQRPMLGKWRETHLGLPAAYTSFLFDGYDPAGRTPPRLHGYSRHLVPKPKEWSARETITGYWFLPPQEDWQPPEDLAQFLGSGPPPMYIGFGSMPAKNPAAQTLTILNTLNQTGERAVLATGWGGLETIAASPAIHVVESAPHSWLFPRCAGIVHHGGAGTTHEALRWGRASFICPVGADQPFWGWRVAHAGAGPEPIAQKHLRRDGLAAAFGTLKDPAVMARAEEVGQAMREEGGAEEAARLIDEFLSQS